VIAEAADIDVEGLERKDHLLAFKVCAEYGRKEQVSRENYQLFLTVILIESSLEAIHATENLFDVAVLTLLDLSTLNIVHIVEVKNLNFVRVPWQESFVMLRGWF
jgi:hypothetical protein